MSHRKGASLHQFNRTSSERVYHTGSILTVLVRGSDSEVSLSMTQLSRFSSVPGAGSSFTLNLFGEVSE